MNKNSRAQDRTAVHDGCNQRLSTGLRVCRALLFSGALAVLSGCMLEPGMHWSDAGGGRGLVASDDRTQSAIADDPPAEVPGGQNEAGANVDAFVEITPALVARQQAERPGAIPENIKKLFGAPSPYLIGAGDVLDVVIWDHPEMTLPPISVTTVGTDYYGGNPVSPGYTVDTNGMVQIAYAGAIKVAGLSEMQARDLIASKLVHYVRNPQITLRVQSYRSRRVYLDGEVRNPGLFVFNDVPMTLMEALNRAGGFTPLADRASIEVIRDGKSTLISIPLLVKNGIDPSAVLLKSGDIVRVLAREESKVFIMGDVTRATTSYLRNGELTLNEALGDAGGLNVATAGARQVFVVRKTKPGRSEIFHLDASSPTALALAEDFELKAKDVVFVDAAPLTRWNRVIALLVPGAQTAYFGRAAAAY